MTLFIIVCILSLLLCCAVILLWKSMCLVTVVGTSMMPLLAHGDRVLVLRWYPTLLLRQGQVVVLTTSRRRYPSEPGRCTWYVKRIVAMAGETFTTDTTPYSADVELDEQQHKKTQVDETGRWSWHIPLEHVFVCGDNRKESIDSRLWGSIPTNQIIGIVLTKLPGTSAAPPELLSHNIIPYTPLPIGESAPNFSAGALNGEIVTLNCFHEKALFFLFIANTQLSYQKIPAFLTLAEELTTHHIAVVFVFDGTYEMAYKLPELLPIAQRVLIAPRETNPLLKDYHVVGTPAHCLLDTRHIVRATGFTKPDAATLLTQLEHAPSDLSQEELNA